MPYVDVRDREGSNLERAFALRPDVYAAWRQLVEAQLDPAFHDALTVGRPIESA